MAGKIFVNYRRDDARDMAARIRDRLAQAFGHSGVFMDVDNLLAGQRFDRELEKALAQTDVFLAVIGPRWMELLVERKASGERDYVREEIAGALQRGILVVPVLIERAQLPRADALPEDIRDLVLHQKHVATHEQFGRDVAGLVEAIRFGRKAARAEAGGMGARTRWVAAVALVALVLGGGVLAYHRMVSPDQGEAEVLRQRAAEKAKQEEIKRAAGAAAAKQKADEAAQARRAAEEAERQRLAMLKAEQDRAAEEARKRAEADLMRPGRVFRDCPDVCPEMVVVPAGHFMMGSPESETGRPSEEGPVHKVTIQRPFAVGKFEVTFAEWEACVTGGGCTSNPRPNDDHGWGRGRRPVIGVSWHDAKEYAAWLSRKTGKTYRLLSEAEWEYAARAGTTTRYAFDTISTSQANYLGNRTMEVGSFPANKFGLHDMHGNVWEWVEDAWHPNYQGAPDDGSVWPGGDTSLRVLRGGSWVSLPLDLRSAFRDRDQPGFRSIYFGFRLSRTL